MLRVLTPPSTFVNTEECYYTQIYTQMVRPKINTDYVRRKRVQSVAKKLNNGMEMTLAVCLFVWAVNG